MTQTVSATDMPRRSRLDRDTAMRLAATEYQRLADLLDGLTEAEWSTGTACTGWDVRAMAGHVLGMAQMASSLVENLRQQRASRRVAGADATPGELLDALTELQVRKNADLAPAELVAALRRTAPRAVAGRRRMPRVVRDRATIPAEVGGKVERWAMGYLLDTILTRDPWMHRCDISVALGRGMELTPDHDGLLVADVVAEWADRHGRPFDLTLTGPAGGHWSRGTDGEPITTDAVQFMRGLSGRGEPGGLSGVPVPF